MIQFSAYKEHYKETIRLGVPIMLGQLGIIIVPMDFNPIVFAELLKNNIQLLVIELIISVFPGNIILCIYVVHGFFITLVVI